MKGVIKIFVIHNKPLSTTPKFVNKVTSGKPLRMGASCLVAWELTVIIGLEPLTSWEGRGMEGG